MSDGSQRAAAVAITNLLSDPAPSSRSHDHASVALDHGPAGPAPVVQPFQAEAARKVAPVLQPFGQVEPEIKMENRNDSQNHSTEAGLNGQQNGQSHNQSRTNGLSSASVDPRQTYIDAQEARFKEIASFERTLVQRRIAEKIALDLARYSARLDLFDAYAYSHLAERAASRMLKAGSAASTRKSRAVKAPPTVKPLKAATAPAAKAAKRRSAKSTVAATAATAKTESEAQAEENGDDKEPAAPAARTKRKRKADTEATSGKNKLRAVDGEEEPAPAKGRNKRKEARAAARALARAERDAAPKPPTAKERAREAKLAKKNAGTAKQYQTTYDSIWRDIARKEIPKAFRLYQSSNAVKHSNAKKTAVLASKESRRWQMRTNKYTKDMQTKARRAMREMVTFWKRNEKEERELRRKAEKEAVDAARKQEEERESRRQARKLNFLITQTELYSHFVGSKVKTSELEGDMGDSTSQTPQPGSQPNELLTSAVLNGQSQSSHTGLTKVDELDFDKAEDAELASAAQHNAQQAVNAARERAQKFDENQVRNIDIDDDEMNFQNPTSLGDVTIPQPKMLTAKLKEYQLKGLNWLANLYDQGINGILADEMGLGKTVQSISVMAYLAEVHDIWGPFLVIAPASTLHNWQQEITRFVPDFKVLPYWGSNKDRKVLRKFWDRKQLRYTRESNFHVLVTSYQLVVADAQYFNRVKWQYMILDEAQAIKSSSSSRWKSLLSMQSRNRLLLTGTPIQNSMQELWALLHFIMPTLFDSHEEFSDWFSKDIESHATKNSKLNEQQLKRLHMILKPFMLRRVKKNVQQELGDKIEIDVYCNLTHRQRVLYQTLRAQISLHDLLERSANDDTQSLMNLVMQFRKVCNHPDLFERADVRSPFSFGKFGNTVEYNREGNQLDAYNSLRNPISYEIPKSIYRGGLVLDVAGDNSDGPLRRKIQRMLTVWDPQSKNIKAIEAIDGTPAGEIVRQAQKGMFERAIASYEPPSWLDVSEPELYSVKESRANDYLRNLRHSHSEMVSAPPVELIGSDRSLTFDTISEQYPKEGIQALSTMTLNQEWSYISRGGADSLPASNLFPHTPGSSSTIEIPSMARFITDSGKLNKLDSLLSELKAGGHRVLVYFQMTKMMDLVEDYLTYRQYKYVRLDGSSKLSDRRDLVNDWQTKPEIFVFLLSTRAGGLGINLTAADTVIFYDSDWNPTIDSQAMDRAHRLGQTRQVTVYRLLVKGTIEERMRDRAKQKEHVQQVVMGGRGQEQGADFQKPGREVAYWLLDDDDSAVSEALQKQEKKSKATSSIAASPQKKKPKLSESENKDELQTSLEEMYHEQEGHFENK